MTGPICLDSPVSQREVFHDREDLGVVFLASRDLFTRGDVASETAVVNAFFLLGCWELEECFGEGEAFFEESLLRLSEVDLDNIVGPKAIDNALC